MNSKKVSYWIEAMRLRTLPVSVAGVLAACGCAVADHCFKWLPAVLCLIFALLCQIASNFANEYYDYKAGRDRIGREGPRRGVTEGDISPRAMQFACFGTLLLAAAIGLCLTYWGGLWLIGAGVIIGLGAMAYSTGPWPLSTHCMGEVAVIIFFGLVPVNLTYYVMSLQWSQPVAAVSLAIGFMGANVLIVNNYRDIIDDKAVGKHTLATLLGSRAMPLLYSVNALIAALLTWNLRFSTTPWWAYVEGAYLLISLAIVFAMSRRQGAALTPLLGITAINMTLFSILFLIAQC